MVIFSVVAFRADLVGYQQRSLARFAPNHELIVVNNGPEFQVVSRECGLRGLRCLCVPERPGGDPSTNHVRALNYLWREHAAAMGCDVSIFDMDVFPLAQVRLDRWLADGQIVGVRQVRGTTTYLWPGMLFIRSDVPSRPLLSFDVGVFGGHACDTGGAISEFLVQHPGIRVHYLAERAIVAEDLPVQLRPLFRPHFLWNLIGETYFHLGSATNWRNLPSDAEQQRNTVAKRWIDDLCRDAVVTISDDHIVTPDVKLGAATNDEFPGFREDYLVLHCLLRWCQPKRVMEVGTQWGTGTNIIKNAVPDAEVFSLDLPDELAHLSTYFIQDVGAKCRRPYIQLRGDSRTFDFSPYRPLDAWFIDGEHSYHHVCRESQEAYATDAKLVVWHDCDIPEVWRAVLDSRKDEYDLYRVQGTRIGYAVRKESNTRP